jgi:hypothetical protein
MSIKYSLNKKDMKKVGKGAGIALGGALLTYIAQVVPNIDFGEFTPLIVAFASILVNFGLKYCTKTE